MKQILIPFLAFLLSCSTEEQEVAVDMTNDINAAATNLFGLMYYDTLKADVMYDTASCISVAQFNPLYIGKLSDSIFLNHDSHLPQRRETEMDKWPRLEGNGLEITVDTTQFITDLDFRGSWVSTENIDETQWKSGEVHLIAYPVILKNKTNKSATVGYGNHLPIIMEAKDSLGDWKPIQVGYTYFCGTDMLFPFLKKDEYLITTCKLFEGEYTTTLRLRYGWEEYAYSNEFSGQIKYSQFARCD